MVQEAEEGRVLVSGVGARRGPAPQRIAFRRLPRGSAILELDGTSDILAAGRALGGHLCLKGDVPAALLSVGSAEDVERYCARLVDEVGRDGGFILSSGFSVPPTTRPDNLPAILVTARRRPLGRS